jgi:hypothetical protein
MTPHRIAASLVIAALATVAAAGCGDDDDSATSAAAPAGTSAAASAAAADSPYCRAALEWSVHELTPFDDADPAATERYMDEYGAFIVRSRSLAPTEIAADWTVNADGIAHVFLPVLQKYGYSLERVASEGTPEEQATLDAPPADIAAAQDRIQAYDARVCASRQPPAADVRFVGPASTAYCEAVTAFDDANDEAFGTGADPAAVEQFVTSPRFHDLLSAAEAAAPPEIHDDAAAVEDFTAEHGVPALQRYGYDLRRLLLEGTPADRAALQSSDPAIFDAFSRTLAYEEQLCGLDG